MQKWRRRVYQQQKRKPQAAAAAAAAAAENRSGRGDRTRRGKQNISVKPEKPKITISSTTQNRHADFGIII
jgi:hypothetical protein